MEGNLKVLVYQDAILDSVVHCELVANHGPVGDRTAIPFFVKLSNSEIKQFQQGALVWEGALFRDLAEAGIDALNGVGCVYMILRTALP